MLPRAMLLRRLCLAGLLSLAGARVSAQLAASSPFLPSAASGAATPTQNAPLEFRGLIETADGVQYRIYDPARKSGIWAKLNERNPDLGVVVKQYDADRNTVTVDAEGKTLTLEERKAKIVSSGSAAAVVPPVPQMQANVSPAVVQTASVTQPTPADEQKRLEAVAQEVARRRALREQATNQLNPGTPPVPVPQVQPAVQNQNNPNLRRGGPVPGRQSR